MSMNLSILKFGLINAQENPGHFFYMIQDLMQNDSFFFLNNFYMSLTFIVAMVTVFLTELKGWRYASLEGVSFASTAHYCHECRTGSFFF